MSHFFNTLTGDEPIMSNSTAKLIEPIDIPESALEWLKRVHDNSCDEQALKDTPIIDEQYKMDWAIKKRCVVLSTKATTVQPDKVHRPIDRDFLDINDVASILKCVVDTVRRIPKEDLAVYKGPGRSNLYLRESLVEYIKQHRIEAPIDASFIEEVLR
jgi:hypothetical protein